MSLTGHCNLRASFLPHSQGTSFLEERDLLATIQTLDHRKVGRLHPLVTLLCIHVAPPPYPLDHFQLFAWPQTLVHMTTSGSSPGPNLLETDHFQLITWPDTIVHMTLLAVYLALAHLTTSGWSPLPPPYTGKHFWLFNWLLLLVDLSTSSSSPDHRAFFM